MSTTPVTYTAEFAAESRLPVILGVLTTFFVISLIIVTLRVYVRGFVTHSFGADDILMIIAMQSSYNPGTALDDTKPL
ncbi:hypothetical protein Sste5344_002439 [Sporothrix stenoceras]